MKLFSKRNKPNTIEFNHRERMIGNNRIKVPPYILKKRRELINDETRNRLISQIQFLATNKDFLEPYILSEDKERKRFTLCQTILDSFSLSELGYKFSSFLKFRELEIFGESVSDDEAQTIITIYDDYKLFDLLETIVLFSKGDKRGEVIFRIDKIFIEEQTEWRIIKNLITKNSGEDLNDISNQLKDVKLASKIKSFYGFYEDEDYLNSSKLSADIINIIFSGFLQNNKKKEINTIEERLVLSVVENKEGVEEKRIEMKAYFDELLKISKDLNNNIFDVRHSEKSTIKVSNPYIYKLISDNNIAIAEFVLTSLKDDFIFSENWEDIKNEYTEKYKIDKSATYFYSNKKEDDIFPEDIPF